jgi:hypothetical protein
LFRFSANLSKEEDEGDWLPFRGTIQQCVPVRSYAICELSSDRVPTPRRERCEKILNPNLRRSSHREEFIENHKDLLHREYSSTFWQIAGMVLGFSTE